MKHNNGVYIVELNDCRRVFHTDNIDHILHFNRPAREAEFANELYYSLKDKQSYSLDELTETIMAAYNLYTHIKEDLNILVEYGIQPIKFDISWSRIVDVVGQAGN